MARTTDDKKGHTIILRVNEGLYSELTRASEREGISLSEYARNIMTDSICNTKKNERKINVLQEVVKEETYKDLARMCELSGFTVGRFVEYVTRMFDDGRIYVDGMILRTKDEYDIKRLTEACHRRNLDPQDIIDRMAEKIIKGC